MKRNQWAAVFVAVLLFVCGLLVGVLAQRYYAATSVSAKSSENSRQHYLSEMKAKLHLTDAQVGQLETIMDETKARYKAVRDSYRPAMVKIKEEHVQRVKSILTAQQVPVYQQLVAERERRAKEQEDQDRRDGQKKPSTPGGR
jgi:hypothetical protein